MPAHTCYGIKNQKSSSARETKFYTFPRCWLPTLGSHSMTRPFSGRRRPCSRPAAKNYYHLLAPMLNRSRCSQALSSNSLPSLKKHTHPELISLHAGGRSLGTLPLKISNFPIITMGKCRRKYNQFCAKYKINYWKLAYLSKLNTTKQPQTSFNSVQSTRKQAKPSITT